MTIKVIRRKREVRDSVKAGKMTLRVFGSEKDGFRLAGQRKSDGVMFPFGQMFAKQMDAVGYGEGKFGVKAVKVVSKGKSKVAA